MSKLMVALFATFGILATIIYNRHIGQNNYVVQTGSPMRGGVVIAGTYDESKLKSNAEWRKILTPKQYYILRDRGTEVPFTGELLKEKRKGTYVSAGCNQPVFRSEQKYDSKTGWPSFWAPISEDALVLRQEPEGERRIEVMDRCGGHLGHVFDDGPRALPDGRQATGKRYCINSAALKFVPDKE
jgi:peptide-methionine (R)-S-oxide reductase